MEDPPALDGALDQSVLEPGRFLIPLDLLRCRLAHVDDGEAFQMGRADPAAQAALGCFERE
jgi:hypothetical protein